MGIEGWKEEGRRWQGEGEGAVGGEEEEGVGTYMAPVYICKCAGGC